MEQSEQSQTDHHQLSCTKTITEESKTGHTYLFRPSWYCRNRHLQTILPYLFPAPAHPPYQRQRLELADGDFLDLDRLDANSAIARVILLHGLEGCSQSHYIRALAMQLWHIGFDVIVMNFRGCSGEPNRLPRRYHAADTGDLQTVLSHLTEHATGIPTGLAGFSLGGSIVLKWLAEHSEQQIVQAGAAISVPFDLAAAADYLNQGVNRIYQFKLLRQLKHNTLQKMRQIEMPFSQVTVCKCRNFRQFDRLVTAPLHGFRDENDYYQQASTRPLLHQITTPTLILHSRDDPFLPTIAIPRLDELSPAITMPEIHYGGHVGFLANCRPGQTQSRLPVHLAGYFHRMLC